MTLSTFGRLRWILVFMIFAAFAGTATAQVSVINLPSTTNVDEPGAMVTFTITVNNLGGASTNLSALTDTVLNMSLNGQGTCVVPQTIAGGGSYGCSYSAMVSGDAGDTVNNTVTATADSGTGTGTGQVNVNDVLPTITVANVPSPLAVDEPGAMVTFMVTVNNTGTAESVELNSLTDNLVGDLNGAGDCTVPQTIATGAAYNCSFSAMVNGNAGDNVSNTVTAMAADDDSNTATSTATTGVGVNDVTPTLTVTSTPSPTNVDEPGATVMFTVQVSNTGTAESADLTTLADDLVGDLNGAGDCAVPQTIATGASYSCTYSAMVSGNAGDTVGNEATATIADDDGNMTNGMGTGTVSVDDVTPSITVTNVPSPVSVPEPGATVSFTVTVTNGAVEPVELTALSDSLLGSNLNGIGDCAVPQTIAVGASYNCTYDAPVNGNAGASIGNTVSAMAQDDETNMTNGSGLATVTVTDVLPTLSVTKTASPTSVDEPGGMVTFTVRVDNTGTAESVTLTSLSDDVHGDLNGMGTCAVTQMIAAGGFYQCSFDATVNGDGGDSETDTVTATVQDDEANLVQGNDSATVTLGDVLPTILVTKTASPTSVDEPGGTVTFTVRIDNTGTAESVDLVALVDDIHGDLAGQGTCSEPQTIATGSFYQCSFDATVNGDAGGSETDTVTATAEDNEGNSVEESDSATVDIIGTDFGDAPASYGTLLTNDGARHVLGSGTFLGASADAEPDGQPSSDATGDDTNRNDDEDGVTFPALFLRGFGTTVDVVAATACTLDAWVDWNADGDWLDNGEQIFTNQALVAGDNPGLAFNVPAGALVGDTFARFRCSTDTGLTPTGSASDGEVEDYQVTIVEPVNAIDVTKTTSPTSVPEPGGMVTFTVRIDNTGNQSVTIDSLTDDIHGDLNGQGDCSVPQVIAAGSFYQCSWSAMVSGVAGDSETNTVTASGTGPVNAVSDSDSATVIVTDDGAPPFVRRINTGPDTGDGRLDACEEVKVDLSQVLVTFNEAMLDPAGNSAADDVTNPTNYRLLRPGGNGSFETTSCAVVAGDDQQIGLTVTYDAASQTATLTPSGLLGSRYHLLICGSLVDAFDIPLDGDFDGTGGDDFTFDFRLEKANLFKNGRFDCNLSGWTLFSPPQIEVQHRPDDVFGAANSGSVELSSQTGWAIEQCVDVVRPGLEHGLRTWSRAVLQPATSVELSILCEFFSQAACGGSALMSDGAIFMTSDTSGLWELLAIPLVPPAGTASARCRFEVAPTAEDYAISFDRIWMQDRIFIDGFESGNLSGWSAAVP